MSLGPPAIFRLLAVSTRLRSIRCCSMEQGVEPGRIGRIWSLVCTEVPIVACWRVGEGGEGDRKKCRLAGMLAAGTGFWCSGKRGKNFEIWLWFSTNSKAFSSSKACGFTPYISRSLLSISTSSKASIHHHPLPGKYCLIRLFLDRVSIS